MPWSADSFPLARNRSIYKVQGMTLSQAGALVSRAVGVMLIVSGGGTLLSIILLALTASGGGGTSHSPPIFYGPGALPTQFAINLTMLSLPAVRVVFGLMLIFFSRAAGHYLVKGLSEKDSDTCL
ncbi:MAG: hypothetical protein K0Q55_2619 [Verrucomicrobia bacterium]|nr:hypothetical protein [Verrucomicrobiota bacterium]